MTRRHVETQRLERTHPVTGEPMKTLHPETTKLRKKVKAYPLTKLEAQILALKRGNSELQLGHIAMILDRSEATIQKAHQKARKKIDLGWDKLPEPWDPVKEAQAENPAPPPPEPEPERKLTAKQQQTQHRDTLKELVAAEIVRTTQDRGFYPFRELAESLPNDDNGELELLKAIRREVLATISVKDLFESSLLQSGTLYGILFDKQRLLEGKATQHISVKHSANLTEALKRVRAEIERRQLLEGPDGA